jgi:hypothetical protein
VFVACLSINADIILLSRGEDGQLQKNLSSELGNFGFVYIAGPLIWLRKFENTTQGINIFLSKVNPHLAVKRFNIAVFPRNAQFVNAKSVPLALR